MESTWGMRPGKRTNFVQGGFQQADKRTIVWPAGSQPTVPNGSNKSPGGPPERGRVGEMDGAGWEDGAGVARRAGLAGGWVGCEIRGGGGALARRPRGTGRYKSETHHG